MCLPADSQAVIYHTSLGCLVSGASGQRYWVKPHVILLDVKARDVETWILNGQARKPSARELATLDGHLARYE